MEHGTHLQDCDYEHSGRYSSKKSSTNVLAPCLLSGLRSYGTYDAMHPVLESWGSYVAPFCLCAGEQLMSMALPACPTVIRQAAANAREMSTDALLDAAGLL